MKRTRLRGPQHAAALIFDCAPHGSFLDLHIAKDFAELGQQLASVVSPSRQKVAWEVSAGAKGAHGPRDALYAKMLSSPSRKLSPAEVRRASEERQARAEKARQAMVEERLARLERAAASRQSAKSVVEERAGAIAARVEGKIARSAELRQAHLAGRVQKAVEETKKAERREQLADRQRRKLAAQAAEARQRQRDVLSLRIEERLREAAGRRAQHLELIKERAALGKGGRPTRPPSPEVSSSGASALQLHLARGSCMGACRRRRAWRRRRTGCSPPPPCRRSQPQQQLLQLQPAGSPLRSSDRSITLSSDAKRRLKGMRRRAAKILERLQRATPGFSEPPAVASLLEAGDGQQLVAAWSELRVHTDLGGRSKLLTAPAAAATPHPPQTSVQLMELLALLRSLDRYNGLAADETLACLCRAAGGAGGVHRGCLALLEALAGGPGRRSSAAALTAHKRWRPPAANGAAIALAFQETSMAGLPSLLTAVLLRAAPSCTPAEARPERLPPNFVEVAACVMRTLNNIARLDLLAAQTSLGAPDLRVVFFHLLLNEVLLLIGHYGVLHSSNQDVLLWGKSPTLLQRLAEVPFVYWVLMPTLVSVCYGSERACATLAQHMDLHLLQAYLQIMIAQYVEPPVGGGAGQDPSVSATPAAVAAGDAGDGAAGEGEGEEAVRSPDTDTDRALDELDLDLYDEQRVAEQDVRDEQDVLLLDASPDTGGRRPARRQQATGGAGAGSGGGEAGGGGAGSGYGLGRCDSPPDLGAGLLGVRAGVGDAAAAAARTHVIDAWWRYGCCAKDPVTGAFVLDRDGKHFALILNWLRDSWVLLPRTAEERRELLQEIRYYQLSGFEGWLRTQEVLSDAGGYGAAEYSAMESPRPRMQYTSLHPQQQHQQHAYTPYGYPTSTLASPPGTATVTSPPRAPGWGWALGWPRPAAHVAPYGLPSTADEAASWTSKYLRGNEGLRELVNTLLELASLQAGKSHVSVHVACGHGSEASLVGSKEEQLRSKLLDIRVRGALGWAFELTLRPSSDAVLWDKYGDIAPAVQDNWFVLGAILKDQFGVVLEEDPAGRPTCAACRRTCLAVTLNKIF
eukprot:XP_001695979.1 predicted protein [Chlamydomonas reinhardtii]